MDNLELYNKVRNVPKEAQKPFDNGRFKGTDINPMWRIKTLTEQFGACGIGWYYEVIDQWTETIDGSQDIIANVMIELHIKVDDEWSKGINGIGGSKVASVERKGLYVNDEAFKMATTDAISVACKNLGIGADIYWNSDNDKYIDHKKDAFNNDASTSRKSASTSNPKPSTDADDMEQEKKRRDYWRAEIEKYADAHGMSMQEVATDYNLNGRTSSARLMEVFEHMKNPNNTKVFDEQMEDPVDEFASIDEAVPF